MNDEKRKVILQAIEYMKSHLQEDITSEGLAKHVGYSPYHFSRVFKEVTGVSPRHYLSALRIEASKQTLVNSSGSILKTVLGVGFLSLGTFSAKFKQFVGLSPKEFKKDMVSLHQLVNEYDFSTAIHSLESATPSVTCQINAPPTFKGIIFVGLFPKPIPDQPPIVGTALNHQQKSCTFSKVPEGEYYVLAAAIRKSLNPSNYFILSHALRGKAEESVKIEKSSNVYLEVTLREPLAHDPPILINLPKLLLDTKKRKEEEKS